MRTDDSIEKTAARLDKGIEKIAKGTTKIALGRHAVTLISRDGEVSVNALRQFLKAEIESSPSS